MTSVVGVLVVLGFLLFIYKLMLPGWGSGRGKLFESRLAGQWRRDDAAQGLWAALLAAIALGELLPEDQTGQAALAGALIALCFTVARAVRIENAILPLFSTVGLVSAVVQAAMFAMGPDVDDLSRSYRAALMGLLFFVFWLSVILSGGRGAITTAPLGLAAVVQLCVMGAHPGGRDAFLLDPDAHGLYLLSACGVSLVAGAIVSQERWWGTAVLGVLAFVVNVVAWATATYPAAAAPGAAALGCAAVMFVISRISPYAVPGRTWSRAR